MKNTYIVIIVLVLVGVGFWFLGTGKKAEAPIVETPTTQNESNQENNIINQEMPAPDAPNTLETSVVKEFTVSGKNFSFTPSLITVKKGDRVKITFNNTEGFHDFKIDEYGVATKQAKAPATEVLEFTADKVGSFEYYCSVGAHRAVGMKGTLKVE